jgi:hypothetical protein
VSEHQAALQGGQKDGGQIVRVGLRPQFAVLSNPFESLGDLVLPLSELLGGDVASRGVRVGQLAAERPERAASGSSAADGRVGLIDSRDILVLIIQNQVVTVPGIVPSSPVKGPIWPGHRRIAGVARRATKVLMANGVYVPAASSQYVLLPVRNEINAARTVSEGNVHLGCR